MHPPRPERGRVLASLVAGQLLVTGVVWAGFSSAPTAPAHAVTTATLTAPTSVSAVKDACTAVTGPVKTKITWTASSAAATTGYQIFRSTTSGSGYASVATVSGASTTSYVDATVTFSTRYYYVVQASRNSWRSANSNEDAVTTQNSACVGGSNN